MMLQNKHVYFQIQKLMNSNVYYLIDPDTGEIIDFINKESYQYKLWKHGGGITPSEDFE